jgi:hypothetical protein
MRSILNLADRDLMAYCLNDTKGPLIGYQLLFARGATSVKSINFFAEYEIADWESVVFYTRCYVCKKHKFLLSKDHRSGAPYFLYAMLRA